MTQCTDLRDDAFQPYSFGGIPKRGDELAGVAAAINQLLDFVGRGATHIMIADIEGFFTNISKSGVLKIVEKHTSDQRFLKLLRGAIHVDLENSDQLWRYKDQFPYGDIGIGQGNCLSPFLGNIYLSDFDVRMNEGDCRCIRYIDDIIIAAPSGRAASARFRLAKRLLEGKKLSFADAKTGAVPVPVSEPFEYLGIEFSREGSTIKKSRQSIVARAEEVAAESLKAMRSCVKPAEFDAKLSIPKTLNRIAGMAKGWSHHYAFCNDRRTIQSIDQLICDVFLLYVRKAGKIAGEKANVSAAVLGYSGLSGVSFHPFKWPVQS